MKRGMSKIIPNYIKNLSPYVPGRLIEDVEIELGFPGLVKLASNENSLGSSPKALEAITRVLASLHRYSDADSRVLKAALARKFGYDPAQIICGNGSSEFILVLTHALAGPGSRVIMSSPSFTLYAKNAQAAGAEVCQVPLTADYNHDLEAILSKVNLKTSLIFLDNPLNPTGAYLESKQVEIFYRKLPANTLLVLDEAYIDFTRRPKSDFKPLLAEKNSHLIVLRTFSKAYGLAGLRAAYAVTNPELTLSLNKVRQPFNMSVLAQAGAVAALDDDEFLQKTLKMTWASLDYFQEKFTALGLIPQPTEANYIMVDLKGRSADKIYQAVLHQGVITRSLTSFGLATHLRVSAGLKEESEALVLALTKVLRL
jgi:histidinol-phosphate aminotransferase